MKAPARFLASASLAIIALASTARAELAPDYLEVDDVHSDVAMSYIDGQWQAFVFTGNDRSTGGYAPDRALLMINDTTKRARPVGAQFDFLGVSEGRSIWQLPASQVPGQLYLGISVDYAMNSAERMLPSNPTNWKSWDPDGPGPTVPFRYVELAIKAVRGPGQFAAWDFPNFAPRAWVATADGIDHHDEFHQLIRSHSHYNLAFTAPGYYEIDIQGRTFLGPDSGPGTEVISPVATFYFQVGPVPETRLRIFRDGTDVVLAWPHPAPGFRLQSSPSLNPAEWTDVLTAPVVVGEEKQFRWGSASGSHFFRLRRP